MFSNGSTFCINKIQPQNGFEMAYMYVASVMPNCYFSQKYKCLEWKSKKYELVDIAKTRFWQYHSILQFITFVDPDAEYALKGGTTLE